MNKIYLILFVAVLSFANGIKRYALVVGANDGGRGRDILRYAKSDGEMFSKVLSEMGGLNSSNLVTLTEPTPKQLLKTIKEISSKISRSKTSSRSEFLFYYSGHANDQGLLLGENDLSYRTLKNEIDKIDTEIKIAILDACASGAITRIKGGVRKQAFLSGDQVDLNGYAILTSSSENEASQESDQIGGSFFTHYLVSGLRGAADKSGDGKVTLNEAYDYAYNETLVRTSRSKGGVQHPNYDMKLSGAGEIIMTDLRKVEASVIIPVAMSGRFFLKNAKGQLVAEIAKNKKQSYSMGLAEGNYELIRLESGSLSHMRFDLNRGENLKISAGQLAYFSPEQTSSRGSSTDDYIREYQADDTEEEVKTLGVSDFLFNKNTSPTVGAQFSLLGNYAHRRHRGLQAALFTNIAIEEVNTQITTGVNVGMGDVNGFQIGAIANFNGSMWNDSPSERKYVKLNGGQFGSSFNYAEEVSGVQLSGGANGAYLVNGVQASGGFNIVKEINGAAIAGALNLSEKTTGVQMATINVSDTIKGVQLGVVNVSGHADGVALGLFNYAGNGILALRYSVDETGLNKFSLASGTEYLYLEYIFGVHENNSDHIAMGLGLGSRVFSSDYFNTHVGIEGNVLFKEDDLSNESVWDDAQSHLSAKAQFGYKPFKKYLEIFVGIKYSLVDIEGHNGLIESPWWDSTNGNNEVRHWPGFHLGISLGQL